MFGVSFKKMNLQRKLTVEVPRIGNVEIFANGAWISNSIFYFFLGHFRDFMGQMVRMRCRGY